MTNFLQRRERSSSGGRIQESDTGPHVRLSCQDTSVVGDTLTILLCNFNRQQTGIQSEDRVHIKSILFRFLPDLLGIPRVKLSNTDEVVDTGDKG